MAPPWSLTSSHLNTASFYYLLDLSSFSLLSTLFLYFCFLIFFGSVPIRHPNDKSSVKSQVSRQDTYIHRTCKYSKIPGTYVRDLLMRVASVGCFPGARRRGSWHFQVASLHLRSSMDLSSSASHYFTFLSKRSGRRMPPAERIAL